MSGSRMRLAWAAEAEAAKILRGFGYDLVVPLAPSFPCDLLALYCGDTLALEPMLWVEVKSSSVSRSRARTPLSPDEEAFARRIASAPKGELGSHETWRFFAERDGGGWIFSLVPDVVPGGKKE